MVWCQRSVNIAVHFIRARSNLSCSSEGFPMYIRCSVRKGRRREGRVYEKRRERGGGKNHWNCDNSDYFF